MPEFYERDILFFLYSHIKRDISEDCHKTSRSDNSLAENFKIYCIYTYI